MATTNYYPKLSQKNADRFNRAAKTCPTELIVKHIAEVMDNGKQPEIINQKYSNCNQYCKLGIVVSPTKNEKRVVAESLHYHESFLINNHPVFLTKNTAVVFAEASHDGAVETNKDSSIDFGGSYDGRRLERKCRGAIISAICEHMRKTEKAEKQAQIL